MSDKLSRILSDWIPGNDLLDGDFPLGNRLRFRVREGVELGIYFKVLLLISGSVIMVSVRIWLG
jgi:hypothetical protein